MLVSEILHILPAPLEWMVLFNLSPIRTMVDEEIIKAMYHLPTEIDLATYSHVVLANTGRFLALAEESRLVEAVSRKGLSRDGLPQGVGDGISHSLFDRFAEQLALFPVDEADCLGLGQLDSYSPVLLHIKIDEGIGQAKAIFEREPSKQHYELLQAVGVKFLGGETKGNYYLAQFQNRLPVHIHAGILSHFSRTAHCNLFFLQHGHIDPPLENGLLQAAAVRIAWAKNRTLDALTKITQDACERSLAMLCQSPPPDPNFYYGDLVPLGFVLNALNTAIDSNQNPDSPEAKSILDAGQALKQFLLDQRQDNLWAFHSNRLITSTDSALVLQGFSDPEAIEALERFADGKGGYYPQLWSQEGQPGKMLFDQSCHHWCQADYATTCMVKTLRQEAGLEAKTPLDYLAAGISTRSGLYFANPYLVDWVLARAISDEPAAAPLRQQLLSEVLSSINEDYSFGKYDIALSTALAILTMATLGCRGRTMQAAQLRLLELINADGTWPVSIPFYSSLRLDTDFANKDLIERSLINAFAPKTAIHQQRQIRNIDNQYHGISLYWDIHRCISTSLTYLALSESSHPSQQDLPDSQQDAHPRYRCHNHCEYIAKFALPPYLATQLLVSI